MITNLFNYAKSCKQTMIVFIVSLLLPCFVAAQQQDFVYGEIIIMLAKDKTVADFQKEFTAVNPVSDFNIEPISLVVPIYLLKDSRFTNKELTLINSLNSLSSVQAAQLNYLVKPRLTPNDAQYSQQWALHNTGQSAGTVDADVDAPEAWDITTGGVTAAGDTIVVAVVDGGVQLTHPDLQANIWRNYAEIPGNSIDDDGNGYIDDVNGWNAYNNTGNLPVDQHGTHVAGIIGAKGNNAVGVSGINWNVKIMNIAGSSGNTATVITAYSYALQQRRIYNATSGEQGAFVVAVNSSFGVDLGLPASFPIWCAFYDTMGAAGILNVGATANANTNVDIQGDIPTACPSNHLVSVTNSTRNDTKNGGAAYGLTTIDLAAPGTSIYNTVTGSNYSNLTGTSMATPMVAGIIGLMYAYPCANIGSLMHQDPSAFALLVKEALLNGTDAKPAFATNTVSGGRANARGALDSLAVLCATPLPLALTKFDAQRSHCDIAFHWQLGEPAKIASFTLQGSSNGKDFETVKHIAHQQSKGADYTLLLENGRHAYYRLSVNLTDQQRLHSTVVAVAPSACPVDAISVYPNPLSGSEWILQGTNAGQALFLYDALGRLVLQAHIAGSTHAVSAINLPKGLYLLQVRDNKKIIVSKKLSRN